MSRYSKPQGWTTEHDTLLVALLITGKDIGGIKADLYNSDGDLWFKPHWAIYIRCTRVPNFQRALEKKRAGSRNTKLPVVPRGYDLNEVAYLESGDLLPVFTEDHYSSQFHNLQPPPMPTTTNNPSSSSASTVSELIPTMPPTGKSPARKKPASRSPPRGKVPKTVDFKDAAVDDLASGLSGLSFQDKNSKYEFVDPHDPIFSEVVDVSHGATNNLDITLRHMVGHKTDSDKAWMDAYLLSRPLGMFEMNEDMEDAEAVLVRIKDDDGNIQKAVHITTVYSNTRFKQDIPACANDADRRYGVFPGRVDALNGSALLTDNKIRKHIFAILAPELVDEEDEDNPTSYSNCDFNNDADGNAPTDGYLKTSITVELGDDDTNYFMFGGEKLHMPTAYLHVQLAVDGTKEWLQSNKAASRKKDKMDTAAYMAAKKAEKVKAKAAAAARAASMKQG